MARLYNGAINKRDECESSSQKPSSEGGTKEVTRRRKPRYHICSDSEDSDGISAVDRTRINRLDTSRILSRPERNHPETLTSKRDSTKQNAVSSKQKASIEIVEINSDDEQPRPSNHDRKADNAPDEYEDEMRKLKQRYTYLQGDKPRQSKFDDSGRFAKIVNRLENLDLCDQGKYSLENLEPASNLDSDKEDDQAIIQYSPIGTTGVGEKITRMRPTTPPPIIPTPAKSRLQSPSKKATRVPSPPGRPSLDIFWNSETVNGWNDRHSPQKPLKTPSKLVASIDPSLQTPTSSRNPPQSPTKRTKAEVQARKQFDDTKHSLATTFLAELDRVITNGQIAVLASSTGGVQLSWSKTLTTTAGRANWRRETVRETEPVNSSGKGATKATHKHFATIELSTKVVDNPLRLHNVLAHEFCHLANFMISGVRDRPHGKEFQAWGRKCTEAFGASRGVEVTTKHGYEIDHKYVWACQDPFCGMQYGRHSKSIDPRRHTCGVCRSRLVQIRPVPRKVVVTDGTRGGVVSSSSGGGGFAEYVKANFASVKAELVVAASDKTSAAAAAVKHGEVMAALGVKYRAEKEGRKERSLGCRDPTQAEGDNEDGEREQRESGGRTVRGGGAAAAAVGLIRPPSKCQGVQEKKNEAEEKELIEVVRAMEVVVLSSDDDDDDDEGR